MAVKPKLPSAGGKNGKYTGEVRGKAMPGDQYAKPHEADDGHIGNMDGMYNDIGEKSGFQTTGYQVKKGTPYGEEAKFNFLPPGMDIDCQENADIREMPYYEVTDISYPGDGWNPTPRKGE